MKRLLALVKYNKVNHFVFFLLSYILCIVIGVVVPLASSSFIDNIIAGNRKQIVYLVMVMVLLWGSEQISGYIFDIQKGRCEADIWNQICKKINHNLLNYDRKKKKLETKDVSQQLGQSFELIKNFFSYYPVKFLGMVVEAICVIVILFRLSIVNAVIIVLFVPLFVLASSYYGDKLSEFGKMTVDSMSESREYLSDLTEISMSERFKKKPRLILIDSILDTYSINKRKQVRAEALFSNFMSYAFMNLLICISLITSGLLVLGQKQSVGVLYAVQLYASHFWLPIEFFVDVYKEYLSDKKLIDDFHEFMNVDLISYDYFRIDEIVLSNYVSLDEKNTCLHKPINFTFSRGNIYVIQGENGVGKTSLIRAVLGLSENYQGKIEVIGYGYNMDYSYAQSEPTYSRFFRDAISEKSSMGQLKYAQLEDSLKEEKSVYIFDEPTNYLDAEKKKELRKRFEILRNSNAIVILVTHDKEIISDDDVVIDLERCD